MAYVPMLDLSTLKRVVSLSTFSEQYLSGKTDVVFDYSMHQFQDGIHGAPIADLPNSHQVISVNLLEQRDDGGVSICKCEFVGPVKLIKRIARLQEARNKAESELRRRLPVMAELSGQLTLVD